MDYEEVSIERKYNLAISILAFIFVGVITYLAVLAFWYIIAVAVVVLVLYVLFKIFVFCFEYLDERYIL
jgi:hypothetical protein